MIAFGQRFGLQVLPIWQVCHILPTSTSGGRWSPQIASRYTQYDEPLASLEVECRD